MRLCRSAVGQLSGSLVRNTAVPGTRIGGLASKDFTKPSRGSSSLRVLLNRTRVPRRQVYITVIATHANARGTHPPDRIFIEFATKKVLSMITNGTIIKMAAAKDQCKPRQITTKAINAVTTIVPDTAIP